MNTHPLYPKRCDIDIDIDDYNKKCPFYEHSSLEENKNTWADDKNISIEELHTRGVWCWNSETPTLVSLKEADIKFKDGKPVTPIKTGIKGRGMLGKYGPNHAADPIITCWINNELHFIAVKRNDTDEWAIPGGMVDAGEDGHKTLRREFKEEACENCEESVLDQIFDEKNGEIMYAGPTYDDPRTTDSAWIETLVVHYHIDEKLADKITLVPQKSEVKEVKWINCNENLYGGHKKFINMVKEKMEYEKLMNAAPYNEPINMENFNEIASVFVYLVVALIAIYYAFQLKENIKDEEKKIYYYEIHENFNLMPMFICEYNTCYDLFSLTNFTY